MAQAGSHQEVTSVARAGDVAPGEMIPVVVQGRALVLANLGDEVVAFQNACLHAHVRLSEGLLDGDVVTCRWHQWRYCVRTGEVITDESPFGTFTTFGVVVEDGNIFVEHDPKTKITLRRDAADTP